MKKIVSSLISMLIIIFILAVCSSCSSASDIETVNKAIDELNARQNVHFMLQREAEGQTYVENCSYIITDGEVFFSKQELNTEVTQITVYADGKTYEQSVDGELEQTDSPLEYHTLSHVAGLNLDRIASEDVASVSEKDLDGQTVYTVVLKAEPDNSDFLKSSWVNPPPAWDAKTKKYYLKEDGKIAKVDYESENQIKQFMVTE